MSKQSSQQDEKCDDFVFTPIRVFNLQDSIDYRHAADSLYRNPSSNDIEKSEAYEVAGNIEYYVGQYHKSCTSFERAILFRDKSTKVKGVHHVKNYLMLGLSKFRVGECVTADCSFNSCIAMAKIVGDSCDELSLMAQGNLSLSKVHKKQFKEAGDLARLSLETAERIYGKESPKVSDYIRILLTVFLRMGDVGRAERLLRTSMKYFAEAEMVLYRAGLKYAAGLYKDAVDILETFYDVPVVENAPIKVTYFDSTRAITEQPMYEAEITYNLGVLSAATNDFTQSEKHLSLALEKLNSICNSFVDSIIPISATFDDPNILNLVQNNTREFILAPLCALSHVLCASTEAQLLSFQGGHGLKIQSGAIIPRDASLSEDGLQLLMRESKAKLACSLSLIIAGPAAMTELDDEASVYSLGLSLTTGDGGSVNGSVGGRSQTESIATDEGGKSKGISPSLEAGMIDEEKEDDDVDNDDDDDDDDDDGDNHNNDDNDNKEDERVEVKGESNDERNYETKTEMMHAMTPATDTVALDAMLPGSELESAAPLNGIHPKDSEAMLAKNIAVSYTNLFHLSASKDSYAAKSVANRLMVNYGGEVPERALDKKKRLKAEKDAKKTSKSKILPMIIKAELPEPRAELCTMKAELLPLANRLSPDEAEYWLEWATSSTKGFGYGMFSHAGNWDNDVAFDYLGEIRRRLLKTLEKKESIHIFSRMAIIAAIAKMSWQLNLKSDCDTYTELFEEVAKELGDNHYRAIARRFRLDFVHWLADGFDEIESGGQRVRRLQILLEQSKEYMLFAEKSSDIQLSRDAIKRVMNVYMEISQGPPPFGSIHDKEMFGTSEELELIGPLDVEDNERNDLFWLRKFSKARGMYFFQKMKNLAC